MPIDRNEVLRIARLARLRIEADEAEVLTRDLERIVAYVDSLTEVALLPDAASLTYFDHDVTREDTIAPCLHPEEALGNAPERDDAFFLVPKIVEKEAP
ncbi:MAG: Asp-tRNA(Asn)/Glu-tRNA(Gln) amidotransferase subunit GatC [Planctomycetota bacterium]|jgi:aspartyl-tRNA(Asn)/glutamyl-tRNA(Gln) amidotransferase subunit C